MPEAAAKPEEGFELVPIRKTRAFNPESALETLFRLAESQFFRNSSNRSREVDLVEMVVNKKLNAAFEGAYHEKSDDVLAC